LIKTKDNEKYILTMIVIYYFSTICIWLYRVDLNKRERYRNSWVVNNMIDIKSFERNWMRDKGDFICFWEQILHSILSHVPTHLAEVFFKTWNLSIWVFLFNHQGFALSAHVKIDYFHFFYTCSINLVFFKKETFIWYEILVEHSLIDSELIQTY